MPIKDLLQISATFPCKETALLVQTPLLEQKLAASVQLSGPMESRYWWRDELHTATEYLMLIKARREAFEAIRTLIESLHPYELPEVIAVPIVEAGDAYRAWVLDTTQK